MRNVQNVWDSNLGKSLLDQLDADARAQAAAREEAARQAADSAAKAQEAAAQLAAARQKSQMNLGLALQLRMYQAAKPSRLRADWNPTDGSEDSELVSSLTNMRSRSRSLIRDTPLGQNAQRVVVTNVIGNGIGMQATVKRPNGERNEQLNHEIEDLWKLWSRSKYCHMGRSLPMPMIDRWCMSQMFQAGECLIRFHPNDFGAGVPLALELIEAERLADEFTSPQVSTVTGNEVRMGVEVDEYFAPQAYYIRDRHPNEVRFRGGAANALRRIPASEIIHLKITDRWPQTRGRPFMHSVITRNNDMDGYIESELMRARVQSATAGAIETPEDVTTWGERQSDGSVTMDLEPGMLKRLNPGEQVKFGSTTAPNTAMEPFMRYLVREFAMGVGCSYESLSRDYSQSNYSSSRLALLDDRDIWRFLQCWYILDCRDRIHEEFMNRAVLAGRIKGVSMLAYGSQPEVYQSVKYKPRGWTWVDPTVEVEAYQQAVKSGFTTVTDVIAETAGGKDIDDVLDTRATELQDMAEKGLEFDTSPEYYMAEVAPEAPPEGSSGSPAKPPAKAPARHLQVAR